MAIVCIKSTIECDGCGVQFQVEHDPARTPPAGWSLFDVGEDAVRGGHVVGKSIFDGSCSVQGGQMLCTACTRKADEASDSQAGEQS